MFLYSPCYRPMWLSTRGCFGKRDLTGLIGLLLLNVVPCVAPQKRVSTFPCDGTVGHCACVQNFGGQGMLVLALRCEFPKGDILHVHQIDDAVLAKDNYYLFFRKKSGAWSHLSRMFLAACFFGEHPCAIRAAPSFVTLFSRTLWDKYLVGHSVSGTGYLNSCFAGIAP